MSGESTQPMLIFSEFAQDPDMRELVKDYVERMPERINDLRSAYENGDFESLTRLAHQLKGSGGGYGFPIVTERARSLEATLHTLSRETLPEADEQICALIEVCGRMAA